MANLLVLTTKKVQGLDLQSRPAATGVTLLLLFVLYISITRFMTWRRLSAFSGPFLASISYLPMLRIRRSGRSHLEYFELSKQYGSLVRIGPNDLLASSPDHLRRMSAARSTYQRSSWYQATRLDPYHDMMGSVMDKQAHMSLRGKVAAGYMGKDNPGLEGDINSQVQSLVSLIKREYLSDESVKPVDFGRLADFYAHDSKSKLAFGKPLGLLETNKDVRGIIAIVKLALDWIQVFTDIPPLQKIFLSNTVLKLLGPKPTDTWGVGYLMGMARELVSSRLGPDAKEQQDLLVSLYYSPSSIHPIILIPRAGIVPQARIGPALGRIRGHVPHHCRLRHDRERNQDDGITYRRQPEGCIQAQERDRPGDRRRCNLRALHQRGGDKAPIPRGSHLRGS